MGTRGKKAPALKKTESNGDKEEILGVPGYIKPNMSKDVLIKKLRNVAVLLSDIDQDVGLRGAGLDSVAEALVHPNLIKSKDADIKLLTACCLSDVLRIYAPEAPYDAEQLKSIFALFIKELRGLEDPAGPSFSRYFYLLERIAVVKSFIIMIDLDVPDYLVDLFKTFFEIISTKHSNKVESHMLDILVSCIDEAEDVSQELLDAILENLIQPRKGENETSYRMAQMLVGRTHEKLKTFITTWIHHIILKGQTSESDLSQHYLELIYELYCIHPNILINILPSLADSLKQDDKEARLRIVQLLGKISADGQSLERTYLPLHTVYLERFRDVDADIRLAMVSSSEAIVLKHPELGERFCQELSERVLDPDERVRAGSVRTLCKIFKEVPRVATEEMLRAIGERIKDKKPAVSRLALRELTILYGERASQLSDDDVAAAYGWIPDMILSMMSQLSAQEPDILNRVERLFNDNIMPRDGSTENRAVRFVDVFERLGEGGMRGFTALLNHKRDVQRALTTYLELRERRKKEDDMAEKATNALRIVGALLQLKDDAPLAKFDLLKDNKIFKGLGDLANNSLDTAGTDALKQDLLERFEATKENKDPLAKLGRAVVNSAANTIAPLDAVQALFRVLEELQASIEAYEGRKKDKEEKRLQERFLAASRLLGAIAVAFPTSFRSSYQDAAKLLALRGDLWKDKASTAALDIFANAGDWVESLDKKLYKGLSKDFGDICVDGTPAQAKLAVQGLVKVYASHVKERCTELAKKLLEHLAVGDVALRSALKAYSYIALLAPEAFRTVGDKVTKFVMNELLPYPSDEDDDERPDRDWDDVSPLCEAKMIGIKLLTNFAFKLPRESATDITKVRKLFLEILNSSSASHAPGEVLKSGQSSDWERAHYRLQTGKGLLKLARVPQLSSYIDSECFDAAALCMQDLHYKCRQLFAIKVHECLVHKALPTSYLAVLALAAVDPEKSNVTDAKAFLADVVKKRRGLAHKVTDGAGKARLLPDYALAHLIHTLAHHPDFTPLQLAALDDFTKYLTMFLDVVTQGADNFSFLYQMLNVIHSTEDNARVPKSTNIYAVAEIAQKVLDKMKDEKKWSLVPHPGAIMLPNSLFRAKTRETLEADSKKPRSFLPREFTVTSPVKPKARDRERILNAETKERAESPSPRREREMSPKPSPSRSAKGTAAKAAKPKTQQPSTKQKRGKKRKGGDSDDDVPRLGREMPSPKRRKSDAADSTPAKKPRKGKAAASAASETQASEEPSEAPATPKRGKKAAPVENGTGTPGRKRKREEASEAEEVPEPAPAAKKAKKTPGKGAMAPPEPQRPSSKKGKKAAAEAAPDSAFDFAESAPSTPSRKKSGAKASAASVVADSEEASQPATPARGGKRAATPKKAPATPKAAESEEAEAAPSKKGGKGRKAKAAVVSESSVPDTTESSQSPRKVARSPRKVESSVADSQEDVVTTRRARRR